MIGSWKVGARAWLAAAVVACVSAVQLPTRAAEAIPADRRLAPDVILYVQVRDVTALKAALSESTLGGLMKEEDVVEFLKQLEEPLAEAAEEAEKNLGVGLWDILSVPQGEMAFALVQSAGKPISGAVFLDFGDKAEIVAKLIEKATTAAEEGGSKRREEEFEDTTIVVFDPPAEEDADDPAEKKAPAFVPCYFQRDTHLVLGSRIETLKAILTRWDGQHDRTFAEKQVFAQIKTKCSVEGGQEPELVWFFDPIGVFRGAMASAADAITTSTAMAFLPTLGLDKLRGMGGTLAVNEGEYDMISRTYVYTDSPTKGILNMFSFPAVELAPPKWVKDDVNMYAAYNWDFQAAYSAAEAMVDSFAGDGSFAKQVDELAETEGGPQIHLKRDVIDNLSGLIQVAGVVATATNDDGDEEPQQQVLFAIDLKNPDLVQKLVTKLTDQDDFPGKKRDFKGTTIYEADLGDEGGDLNEVLGTVSPAVAIVHKQLLFSTNVALLESVIQNDEDRGALADLPAYQEIAKRFPEKSSSIAFQRSDSQIKVLYETLRKNPEQLQDADIKLDFSKLPPFETIQQYLLPQGGYMLPDEKGVSMISFTLKRKVGE